MAAKKSVQAEPAEADAPPYTGFTPIGAVAVLRVRMADQTTDCSSFEVGDQLTNGPLSGGVVAGVHAVQGGFIVDIDVHGKAHSLFLTGGDYSALMAEPAGA